MIEQYHQLRETSRTFALSIEQLPPVVRDAITLAYLLLRVSDFLEDNDFMAPPQKVELLHTWDQVLDGAEPVSHLIRSVGDVDHNDAEAVLTTRADGLLAQLHKLPSATQEIILRYVRQTTIGMARWQEQGPLVETEAEMDDYMHWVAGIVGYLITEVFAWYSPYIKGRMAELMPLSREYGLALQTVNIIRGMRKDYERGWVFVPRTFYEEVGLDHHQLFDPAHREAAMQVVARLAAKAEDHLRHGLGYITAFPRRHHRIRLGCMWPLFFAVKTLAVSRDNPKVLQNEAKMTRAEVTHIMRLTTAFGWSNQWLDWYYAQLARPIRQP